MISSRSHGPSLYRYIGSIILFLIPHSRLPFLPDLPAKGIEAGAYEAKAQVPIALSLWVETFLREGITANYTVSIGQDYKIYI